MWLKQNRSQLLLLAAIVSVVGGIAATQAMGQRGNRERAKKQPDFGRGRFAPGGFLRATALPDISGMAWIGGNTFLAAHDAKAYDGEEKLSRMSILQIPGPSDTEGILYRSKTVRFEGILSNDLESAASIPGTDCVLLVESGDSGDDPDSNEIYRVRVSNFTAKVVGACPWPTEVTNVEGTAVAKVGEEFVFIFAERAEGALSTLLKWAPFDPESMSFDEFQEFEFFDPDPLYNRPVVGIDVDSHGNIYTVAAYDPDEDAGPYAAAVYRIGVIQETPSGTNIVPESSPILEGVCDGFKVESVAVLEENGIVQLFIGTDDENYGGTVRPLPVLP